MKRLATTICIFSFIANINLAQINFLEIVDYNQEFMTCSGEYADLVRKSGENQAIPDTFYLNGNLYNGCAKQDHPKNKHYYIYYIKNGFVEKLVPYYYNGQKAADFNFKDGKPFGYHNMYFDSGLKYTEDFFDKNGKLDGYQRRWYNNGQLAEEKFYENGKMKSVKFYDKDGKESDGC